MLRRICSLPLLALAVTAAMFFLASLSPFDPLEAYTHGNAGALTDEQREDLIRTLNIEGPWYASWWSWVTSVCTGDLGTSRFYRMPVADVLAQRLGWSILLGALALTLTLVVSFVLGVVAGLREGGLVDRIAGFIATLLQSLPPLCPCPCCSIGLLFVDPYRSCWWAHRSRTTCYVRWHSPPCRSPRSHPGNQPAALVPFEPQSLRSRSNSIRSNDWYPCPWA